MPGHRNDPRPSADDGDSLIQAGGRVWELANREPAEEEDDKENPDDDRVDGPAPRSLLVREVPGHNKASCRQEGEDSEAGKAVDYAVRRVDFGSADWIAQ